MSGNLVLLAAGGTGGHVFPAEALAQTLIGRGWRLGLVTDRRGHAYGGSSGRQSGDNLTHGTPRKGKFTSFPVGSIRAK